MVVFLPSYDYLNRVLQVWQKPDGQRGGLDLLQLIGKQKAVYHESKGKAGQDDLLQQYSKAIDTGKGAVLFSVVGGKLSEGINFSDKLGRGVVVVGLPFPNINSAEWKAKIEHIENKAFERYSASRTSKSASESKARATGREYYENACMRAVNQCIGRAIRHQNDYAAIVLIDRRYTTDRIQGKMPAWIRQSMVKGATNMSIDRLKGDFRKFFEARAGSI